MGSMIDGCSKFHILIARNGAVEFHGFNSAEEGARYLARCAHHLDSGKFDFPNQYERMREIGRKILAEADESEKLDSEPGQPMEEEDIDL